MQQAEIGSQSQGGHELYVPEGQGAGPEISALLVRLAHACIAVGLAATLLLSLWLEPDPRGLGTHEQLLTRCPLYQMLCRTQLVE